MSFGMEANSNQNGIQIGSVGNHSNVTYLTIYFPKSSGTEDGTGDDKGIWSHLEQKEYTQANVGKVVRIWLERKKHSVEGHTAECTLSFNGTVIWGPQSCHHNTIQLRDVLYEVDSRFMLDVWKKPKTIEGHTYSISVMVGDRLYLDRLSTHGNMIGLCQAINKHLASERGQTLRVWLEPKDHSVEGHIAQCTLSFKGRVIWGPHTCHSNTIKLADALLAADSSFRLTIRNKHKTIEGHTYTISVMAGDRLYLDRLSTHDNMLGLCQAINDCLGSEREN